MKTIVYSSLILILVILGCNSKTGGIVDAGKKTATFVQPENPNKASKQNYVFEQKTITTQKDGTVVEVIEKQTATQEVSGTWEDVGATVKSTLQGLRFPIVLGGIMIPLGVFLGFLATKRGWPVNAFLLVAGVSGSGIALIALSVFFSRINPYVGLGGAGSHYRSPDYLLHLQQGSERESSLRKCLIPILPVKKSQTQE